MTLKTLAAAGLIAATAVATFAALGGAPGGPTLVAEAQAQETAAPTGAPAADAAPAALASTSATAAPATPAMDAAAVIDLLAGRGFTAITEVEREHGRWEVEATDPSGQRVEVYLDAVTGDILKQEREWD